MVFTSVGFNAGRWLKLWVVLVLTVSLLSGCRRTVGASDAGAATPQDAIARFLDAARARDLNAMADYFGTATAPTRTQVSRQELEQRLLIMICLLRHDASRIGVPQLGPGGRQVYKVKLTQGSKEATVPFTTVRNPKLQRWFVEEFDPRPLRDFCTNPPPASRR
jgi:hypothetical protein